MSLIAGPVVVTLIVSGVVTLQPGPRYGVNAAGVVVLAGTTAVGGVSYSGLHPFGSLVVGNSGLGWAQLFPADAAHGLGSGSPPTTLTLTNAIVSSLGGPFGSTIPAGTTLQFKVWDTYYGDNTGLFSLSQPPPTRGEVPEPASAILFAAGALALLLAALERKRISRNGAKRQSAQRS